VAGCAIVYVHRRIDAASVAAAIPRCVASAARAPLLRQPQPQPQPQPFTEGQASRRLLPSVTPALRCAVYHGGLPDRERTAVLEAWTARRLDVVVATIAFGMGIDRPGMPVCRGAHWLVRVAVPRFICHPTSSAIAVSRERNTCKLADPSSESALCCFVCLWQTCGLWCTGASQRAWRATTR
jgi:hypothetical protein